MTESFDIAALTYDEDFTESLTGQLQRKRVWKYLDQCLATNDHQHILEINCGTGEDALHMAQLGHVVTATDISEQMLSVARHKIGEKGLCPKVCLQKADMARLEDLQGQHKYDLIFSNFGGVNCLAPKDMESLAAQASQLLKPGGKLVMVIMPRFCAWESLYFLLKGKWGEAFRRRKTHSMANVSGEKVKTWYHSSRQIKSSFKSHFRAQRLRPIGLFGPPSYLEPLMRRNKALFHTLAGLENTLALAGWQANLADHYYLEMEVKQA